MPGWASPWLWTAETWAGLQFGVLFVGLIVAWTQVREAVRLREDSTRPFVSIDLYVDDKIIHLSVTNLGPTMARDIQFAFEPPLRSASVQDQIASLKMFGPEGIPTLPPGKVITTVFDVFRRAKKQGATRTHTEFTSPTTASAANHTPTTSSSTSRSTATA
jgi:hypothetical protein